MKVNLFCFVLVLVLMETNSTTISARMDCHTVIPIEKGFKSIFLEIEGLRRNIDVILTDREFEKSICGRKNFDFTSYCPSGSLYCKGHLT